MAAEPILVSSLTAHLAGPSLYIPETTPTEMDNPGVLGADRLMAIVNNVVDQFRRAGLPPTIGEADLQQEGFLAATGVIGQATEFIAATVQHRLREVIREAPTQDPGIADFMASYLAEMQRKIYRAPGTITDPIEIHKNDPDKFESRGFGKVPRRLPTRLETRHAEWEAMRKQRPEAVDARTRAWREILAERVCR